MRLVPFVAIMAALFPAGSPLRAEETFTLGQRVEGDFDGIAQGFLEKHCLECHDDLTTEGDLNLLDLGPVDETNAAVWK